MATDAEQRLDEKIENESRTWMEQSRKTHAATKGHWRGLNTPDDAERGIAIYEMSPWPPIPNVRGTTRLVAANLGYADAERILKAVGGDWA